jgi:metal-responsive CopG/Arc/MetJ family transcriptional regulator
MTNIVAYMRPIQILMDERLIREVDREAKRRRTDRSKLMRAALQAFLAGARRQALDERYRRGYEVKPQRRDEIEPWEEIQAWPEE